MMGVSLLLPREGLLQANEMHVGLGGPDEVDYVEPGLACNTVCTTPPSTTG